MSDTIKVTVDGEPVTREVTLEQVRAYLARKGWRCNDEKIQRWPCPCEPACSVVVLGRHLDGEMRFIARHEQRHPAEVLREIAGVGAEDAPLDLDAIEARANAATPGPWETYRDDRGWAVIGTGNGWTSITDLSDAMSAGHDATMIAHARADVPALVAEVRRLRAVVNEARAAPQSFANCGGRGRSMWSAAALERVDARESTSAPTVRERLEGT